MPWLNRLHHITPECHSHKQRSSLLWPHQQPSEQAHLPPETVSSSRAQILDLSYILSAKGFWHNVALHYVFVNLNMSVMTEQLYREK